MLMADTLPLENGAVNPKMAENHELFGFDIEIGNSMADSGGLTPLSLSVDAGLDHALTGGWGAWRSAAAIRKPAAVKRWLVSRLPEGVEPEDVQEPLLALIGNWPADDRAMAAVDLAELFEADDPVFASLLWEAVLEAGQETRDAELVFEGVSRLAGIEEEFGDPLTAAEFYVEFLSWRRQADHASDPEAVMTAFDEVIRLAEVDFAPRAAAQFTFFQAQFLRIVETGSTAAEVGDWAPTTPPFMAWDSD